MVGTTNTGAPVGRPLPDSCRAPTGVAAVAQSGRSDSRDGDGVSRREVGERGAVTNDHRGGDDGWGGGKGEDKVVEGGGDSQTSIPI